MSPRGKMEAVVCAMCGRATKKLPASWISHGSDFYCGACWSTVQCAQCGHSDPKGSVFRGKYRCRACCHRQRVGASDSLDAHHRFVIEDCNGEAMCTEDMSACKVAARDPSVASTRHEPAIDVAEDDAFEASEEGDALAPLPGLLGAARSGPTADRAALRAGHVVLLLDVSGSMRTVDVRGEPSRAESGREPAPVARIEAAARCAADFVAAHQRLFPRDAFSVVCFNEAAEVECAGADVPGACGALNSMPLRCAKGTSYLSALEAGSQLLPLRPGAPTHLVLLSDGRPADPKAALEYFQAKLLPSCGANKTLHLHGIGFGDTVRSFAALQQLACLGGGAFALAGSSVGSLCDAFASVSSTITSISSGSSLRAPASGERPPRTPRLADFEVPEQGAFGKRGTLRFRAGRATFHYDGADFREQHFGVCEVVRRTCPHMRGGMRLVYSFSDKRVVAEDGSWMVAKCSRWLDEALNSREVVEAHAKSTAVARYYAARFNEQLRMRATGLPSLFFVPCSVYAVADGEQLPEGEPRVFAGERYLPGVFLKYTSNNGYVASDGPGLLHRDVVEAFAHFSFTASGGAVLVSDLQGVARAGEVLLTDPQVLALRGPRFGPGDLGARGACACLAAHRCGRACRLLGLRPVSAAQLRRLAAAAAPRASRGMPASELSAGWERCTEPGAGSDGWEEVADRDVLEFALSDGHRSSQASSSSWVHLLDS